MKITKSPRSIVMKVKSDVNENIAVGIEKRTPGHLVAELLQR